MSSRADREKEAQKKWNRYLVAVLIVIIICVVSYVNFVEPFIERTEDQCRKDGVVSIETAFIIDATDHFSESQAERINLEVKDIIESAEIDERFTVYVLDDKFSDANSKIPHIIVCNPGDGKGKSEFTNNLRRLNKNWDEKFYSQITSTIENLVGEGRANQSPILEMIEFASINTMSKSKAKSKRMILISDMLHHNKEYSHYTSSHDFEEFKKLAYYVDIRPQLLDVNVKIFYLASSKNISLQKIRHANFWKNYVLNAGGKLDSEEFMTSVN